MCACKLRKVLSCYGFCASVWVDHPLVVGLLSSNYIILQLSHALHHLAEQS